MPTSRHLCRQRRSLQFRPRAADAAPRETASLSDFDQFVVTWRDNDAQQRAGTPLTTTAKNARLRAARWEVWRRADAIANYWHVLLEFNSAVSLAKKHGLKEARAHVDISDEPRWPILDSYREALGKQLLTPAPNVASVNWKRHQIRRPYFGVKKELVEKAIADDIAFLDAHPARSSRANKLR